MGGKTAPPRGPPVYEGGKKKLLRDVTGLGTGREGGRAFYDVLLITLSPRRRK